MTEVLKNILLAAGAFYLVYRIYSSYIRPVWNLLCGKRKPPRTKTKQAKLPIVPQRTLLDVAEAS
jgi:hypothetical protein